VPRSDRWVGFGLAILALAVLWTAREFPQVPGQRLGAAFLPMIIGAGLLLCGLALIARSFRVGADGGTTRSAVPEHFGSAGVVVGTVLAYIFLADRLGFLLLAPLCLLAVFRSLRVPWRAALWWAIGGTLVVHLTFYKLLRVPLPWGPITPFY
jgi:putative tricarboxylic transport membrane protein